MLDTARNQTVPVVSSLRPFLAIVVDTEEEFDWGRPLSRSETGVSNIARQWIAHRVFERYGARPTYVVDWPVATRPEAMAPLSELLADDRCEIGAHLHPWVNPPFDEDLCSANSYAGNLPAALEREKLARLTRAIEDGFGRSPRVYRAGRFGVGPNTGASLAALGYDVDSSVVPESDFRADGGPDFRAFGVQPYRFQAGERTLLELPLSVGFTGLLAGYGHGLHAWAGRPAGRRFRLTGLLARLRLFDRVRLSPEGCTLAEQRRLTRALLARGQRFLTLTYHSPSLMPGGTPYVRSKQELNRFLGLLDEYLAYFTGEVGGEIVTLSEAAARLG